jgi:hypothetical protein
VLDLQLWRSYKRDALKYIWKSYDKDGYMK